MATSKVRSGYGVELWTDIAVPSTFAKLDVEILSVGGPPISRDSADATHAASPEQFEEQIPTIIRTGNMPLALNFVQDNAATAAFIDAMKAGTIFGWQLRFPAPASGTQKMFSGTAFGNGFEPTTPHDGKMTANASLRITGPVDGPEDLPS